MPSARTSRLTSGSAIVAHCARWSALLAIVLATSSCARCGAPTDGARPSPGARLVSSYHLDKGVDALNLWFFDDGTWVYEADGGDYLSSSAGRWSRPRRGTVEIRPPEGRELFDWPADHMFAAETKRAVLTWQRGGYFDRQAGGHWRPGSVCVLGGREGPPTGVAPCQRVPNVE